MKNLSFEMRHPKLAVIGCGLQAEMSHLPAIAAANLADITLLVDKVLSSARRLAEKCPAAAVTNDYRQAIGCVDAALVALPNYLHAPVTADLLRHGIHVLVEKPMALNAHECDEMIQAANSGNAVLAVGMDFRFTKASRFAWQILKDGFIGKIAKFDLRIGNDLTVFSFKSDYLLRKETAGGGVLIDLGVHALDLILWWLGDHDRVDYYDDAMGGVESNCEVHLQLRSGARGLIEVSRTRALRNTCVIWGELGTLEVGLWTQLGLLNLTINNQPITLSGTGNQAAEWWRDVFRRQIEDFVTAIRDGREPFVPGCEGKRSIKLIDECYGSRRALPQPWAFPAATNATGDRRPETADSSKAQSA